MVHSHAQSVLFITIFIIHVHDVCAHKKCVDHVISSLHIVKRKLVDIFQKLRETKIPDFIHQILTIQNTFNSGQTSMKHSLFNINFFLALKRWQDPVYTCKFDYSVKQSCKIDFFSKWKVQIKKLNTSLTIFLVKTSQATLGT